MDRHHGTSDQCGDAVRDIDRRRMLYSPGIWEIYEFLFDKGVKVSIKNKRHADRCGCGGLAGTTETAARCHHIVRASPAVYEAVAGVGMAFEKVTEAIDLLVERKISTHIIITAIRQNYHDVDAIIALAKRRNVGRVIVEPTIISPRPGVANDAFSCALDYSEKVTIWEKNLELLNIEVNGCFDPDVLAAQLPETSEEQFKTLRGMSCVAGMCSFHITREGVMQPCVEYPLASARPFEMGFDKAWRVVNEAAHAYSRTPECLSVNSWGIALSVHPDMHT